MIKPVNWFSFSARGNRRFESNSGVSLTVPDMTLSLRDLLNRHNSGGKVKTFEGVYVPPDSAIPLNLERMDKIERAQLGKDLADFVTTTRGRIVSARQKRERDAHDAMVIDRAAKSAAVKASVDPIDVGKSAEGK